MMARQFAIVMVMCLLVQVTMFASRTEAITCGQVQSGLAPCLGYLTGRALAPQCCPGVRSLVSAARTRNDRQTACRCLQQAARSIRGINYGNAARLPRTCGARIPFAISPNTNCNRIG